jgi:hypothetical protein
MHLEIQFLASVYVIELFRNALIGLVSIRSLARLSTICC